MSPQPRGIVPAQIASQIHDARGRHEEAAADLDRLVLQALHAGGSVREVMKLTGWSSDRVTRVGREGGWPTAEQKARREEIRAKNAAWKAYLEQHPDGPPST